MSEETVCTCILYPQMEKCSLCQRAPELLRERDALRAALQLTAGLFRTAAIGKIDADRRAPELLAENAELKVEVGRLHALLNTPEIESFDKAVPLEAAHQQERWGAQHDAGKNPEDWFWLIGYLAGKALHSMKTGNRDKAMHHTISTAAALRNWHAHIRSGETAMRPGIEEPNV